MMRRAAASLMLATLALGCAQDPSESSSSTAQPIVRGVVETGRPQVVMVHAVTPSGGSIRCSGAYFASRVVLTAAHCLPAGIPAANVHVYFGKDYATDKAQLPNIPAPSAASVWAGVDSFELHPAYDPNRNFPDLAVVYLDRKLPFDPLPLYRANLGKSWEGKSATIVGWGASMSLTADTGTVEGDGIKRSGTATIVGSPTAADYRTEDPNAGLLEPAIRKQLLKLDGNAPKSNTCAGDSGGPMIVRRWGQDYIAGVSFWTGLWCEEYSMFTRLDQQLPFLDRAYMRGGQAPVVPKLECVDAAADGKLRAYYDYKNDNGVAVDVPLGVNNFFYPTAAGASRPTHFAPGQHDAAFRATFTDGQNLVYKLSPTNSPTTVILANAKSPRCPEGLKTSCLRYCEGISSSPCDLPKDPFGTCVAGCMETAGYYPPNCEPQLVTWQSCVGTLSAAPENWYCDMDYGGIYPMGCQTETDALNACLGG